MSKLLFYLIYELAMNQYDENEDNVIDKLLLIFRRIFVVLFLGILIWILLFKIIGIGGNKNIDINTSNKINDNINNEIDILDEKNNNEQKLGNNYSIIENKVYYKGEEVYFVNANKFIVIDQKSKYNTEGIVINSDNLLKIFADYNTRVLMMKHIDNIISEEKNVTSELKTASQNGMYKMSNQYYELSQFDWNDRYNMTNEQRAKFAIIFLYIKIIKSMPNSDISMEVALSELKLFIENFDIKNLNSEIKSDNIKNIKGDIGLDDYCIYLNGKLYACFLDKIFIE